MKTLWGVVGVLSLAMSLNGCAVGKAWKGLVSSDDDSKKEAQKATIKGQGQLQADGQNGPNPDDGNTSFNSNPNFGTYQERQYKRVTKQNFTEKQNLEDNSGSLWKKEGQGSYLFAQNNLRVLGDVINVDVDGKISENLNTKIALIKKSQAKFEVVPVRAAPKTINRVPRPENAEDRDPASAQSVANAAPVPAPAVAAQPAKTSAAIAANDDATKADERKEKEAVKFDPVTCRIVEKNPDGSYRIKGTQNLIVGRKEYRLIVTGLVRADDINSENVAATKIMESKFDLVATNREVEK